MTRIAHRKIAGLEPVWAPFAGFSVLFDNPGAQAERSRPGTRLAPRIEPFPELDFYSGLAGGLRRMGGAGLTLEYALWLLPPATYHVTAWDGVNPDNVEALSPGDRTEVQRFLEALPASLAAPPKALDLVTRSTLVSSGPAPIELGYDSLTLGEDSALVARLAPAASSQPAFARLLEARGALSEAAHEALGIDLARPYQPHVSLGYFAHEEGAAAARPRLAEWDRLLSETLSGRRIGFGPLGVYAFSDMATFYRVGDR
jgi:hypothetical protein